MPDPSGVFQPDFLIAIRALINVHHSIYPKLPPQGVYFEALVEEAFRWIKKPFTVVQGTGRNLAGHDLVVEDKKISLKTETGAGTDAQRISITKLCTTERDPWAPEDLIARVMAHLGRYDNGKCSIRNFPVENCVRLLDWELPVPEGYSHLSDLRNTSQ
ncbi:MAG: hypothetical protein HY235_16940 [Acidobacteria bacterium]|nr:hypothetical protein [Acidobacteriota bacterium]